MLGCCEPKVSEGFPPFGQILVLVPRFNRESCHDIPGPRLLRDKNGARFEFNFFFFNEGRFLNK